MTNSSIATTQLLAHRGLWFDPAERNTLSAFRRAWDESCGIETDIRDNCGQLVVSHDPPLGGELEIEEMLTHYVESGNNTPLALNIKSDGLAEKVRIALEKFQIHNYYCFDMSLPDSLSYHRLGLKTLGRVSEFEPHANLHSRVCGVWLDGFYSEWYEPELIKLLCDRYALVCLVSPELHQRPHQEFWQLVTELPVHPTAELQLCTDYPLRFKELRCQ